MNERVANYVPGLEGVVVGETAISHVEGKAGRLSYRGVPIETLSEMSYLEVMHLLVAGHRPSEPDLVRLVSFMAEHGKLCAAELQLIAALPADLHPMRMLQAVVPALTLPDVSFDMGVDFVAQRELSEGLLILAKYPMLLAAIAAHRGDGADTGQFESGSDYLGNFLAMMNAVTPDLEARHVFRTVQILQMDHSFNAGTFASRVISSTLAPLPAVLAGGVAALSGTLHGGADEAALLTARRVGKPEAAEDFVDELLVRKGRLMGMGHREYRTVDPRAKILKPLARQLATGTPFEQDFLVLEAIEAAFNRRMADRGKQVWANLEFYKGVVYEVLGVRVPYFTATFAMARSVGWLAHFLESRQNNRIIRPAAHYVGPAVSVA